MSMLACFIKGSLYVDYPLPISTYRSINVLADGFAGVLGVLKEVLNNGKIPKRYLESARIAAASDWGATTILLERDSFDSRPTWQPETILCQLSMTLHAVRPDVVVVCNAIQLLGVSGPMEAWLYFVTDRRRHAPLNPKSEASQSVY